MREKKEIRRKGRRRIWGKKILGEKKETYMRRGRKKDKRREERQ